MLSKVVSAVSVCVGVSRAAENGACSMHASQVHSRVTPSILDRARTAQERAGELDHHTLTLSDNNHDNANDLISQQNPVLNPRVRTDHSASLLRAIKKKRRFVVQTEHLSNNGKWMETQLFEVDEYAPSVIHPLHGSVLGYFTKSDNGQLYWNEYSVRDSFETPDREEIEMNEDGGLEVIHLGTDVRLKVELLKDIPSNHSRKWKRRISSVSSVSEPSAKKPKHSMRGDTSMVKFRDKYERLLQKVMLQPHSLDDSEHEETVKVLGRVAQQGGFKELGLNGTLKRFLGTQKGIQHFSQIHNRRAVMSVDELIEHIGGTPHSMAWKEWFGHPSITGSELKNGMRNSFAGERGSSSEYRKILCYMIEQQLFLDDQWFWADSIKLESLMGKPMYSILKSKSEISEDMIEYLIGKPGSNQRRRFMGDLNGDTQVITAKEEAQRRDQKWTDYLFEGDLLAPLPTDDDDEGQEKEEEMAMDEGVSDQGSDDSSLDIRQSTQVNQDLGEAGSETVTVNENEVRSENGQQFDPVDPAHEMVKDNTEYPRIHDQMAETSVSEKRLESDDTSSHEIPAVKGLVPQSQDANTEKSADESGIPNTTEDEIHTSDNRANISVKQESGMGHSNGNPHSSTQKQSINANIQQPRVEIDLTVEEDEPTLVQCRRGRPMFFF